MLIPLLVLIFVSAVLLYAIHKKYPKREILMVKLCLIITMIALIAELT